VEYKNIQKEKYSEKLKSFGIPQRLGETVGVIGSIFTNPYGKLRSAESEKKD